MPAESRKQSRHPRLAGTPAALEQILGRGAALVDSRHASEPGQQGGAGPGAAEFGFAVRWSRHSVLVALAIIGLAVSLVALSIVVLQQLIERPRLRVELSPWSDPQMPWKFVAVRVWNLRMTKALRWLFNRRSAEACEVGITFRRVDEPQRSLNVLGRWSAHPEPYRLDVATAPDGTASVVSVFEQSLVPGSYHLDIPATGAWQEVAIAVRRDGEVYAFSAESYSYADWKRPEWRLEPGDWEVDVTAESVNASATKRFRLRITTDDFELRGDVATPALPPAPPSVADTKPETDARVAELADSALENERQSAENLGARSSWLIGFAGVVLVLVVGLNQNTIASVSGHQTSVALGKVGAPVFAGAALAAVVSLLLAAVVARRAVQPRVRGRIPSKLLHDLRVGRVAVERADAELARLKLRMYDEEAASNDSRGEALQRAFELLVLALVLVSAQAAILFLHRAKVW